MEHQEYRVQIFCCMYKDCNKEYQTKYNLLRHLNINHLKKKQGNCSICNKEFIDMDNLKEHMNIHSDVKPYVCRICLKSFRNKCMLTRHVRDHELPFDN